MPFSSMAGSLSIEPGDPTMPGANLLADGVSFTLFSAAADKVELCLFDKDDVETHRLSLPEQTNGFWHGFVPRLGPGQRYGYRVHGRYAPEEGLRFNTHKLLIDPYARQLSGELVWHEALYGYDLASRKHDLSFSTLDSAAYMPKAVVTDFPAAASITRPRIPWERMIVYETHVRGTTMLHPAIPEEKRGTFAAMGEEAIVAYIRSLGVTTVELLPVHAFVDDHHLVEKGLRNYWGYNTIGFFAPQQRYLGAAGLESFRDMVRRFHAAGIEVLLDVVYNHTAEGNERGATLSFRGIDNTTYYRLLPDKPRYYVNDTGTGNTINAAHPRVIQLVLDSLRYWAEVMEVDGFRFDLAPILGREPHGFDPGSGFFDAIGQDPVLRRLKLIAEPWDIGPGGYQVGGFPAGWGEWNDRFRDTMRGFWRGDGGLLRNFAASIGGSGDIYDPAGRAPSASVNFVTAHDGFTLHDLVSYEARHNEANGENNADGHGHNLSMNHGIEGETEDEAINAARDRHKRNLLATLFLAHGTPMLLGGDELGRSQRGNNNAYCQDNELSWIAWPDKAAEPGDLLEFTRAMINLRQRHAIFRRSSFRDSLVFRWLRPDGEDLVPEDWDNGAATALALWLQAPETDEGARQALVLFNPTPDAVAFRLPEGGHEWRQALASAECAQREDDAAGLELQPRSISILLADLTNEGTNDPRAAFAEKKTEGADA